MITSEEIKKVEKLKELEANRESLKEDYSNIRAYGIRIEDGRRCYFYHDYKKY